MPLVNKVRSTGYWATPVSNIVAALCIRQALVGDVRLGGQEELRRPEFGAALETGGEVEIFDGAVEHQVDGFQAVAVLDDLGAGFLDEFLELAGFDEVLGAAVEVGQAERGVAAREGGLSRCGRSRAFQTASPSPFARL